MMIRAIRNWLVPAMAFGVLAPVNVPRAQDMNPQKLGAVWTQWAYSIPTSVNPMVDPTGANCMVGQHGSLWFLAGVYGGGAAIRQCSIPENTSLFFPVINGVQFNTPNVCGQGPLNLSVQDMRAWAAAGIDAATNVFVTLDGKPLHNILRLQSDEFALTIPDDNFWVKPCKHYGGSPGGVYSPAVDDGLYMMLGPLPVGRHTLHMHAESGAFVQDVTYNLNVVAFIREH
ncbi:MAG TPA: hypothetical protein VFA04_01650 [Bryobacteraceae bacterium]|nr:hypothetical protein [Bryobacteraceae bacterium]